MAADSPTGESPSGLTSPAADLTPTVTAVCIVGRERRNPSAMATVALGPIALDVTLTSYRSGRVFRLPWGEGREGVSLSPNVRQATEAAVLAAVQANAEVWAHLTSRRR